MIDDGSEDETDQLAEKAGAKVLRIFGSHGKGAALEFGAQRVEDADIVLLLDGDLGGSAAQGALLLAPVIAGDADMAIAAFPRPAGKAGFGLVKGLARWGILRLGGEFEATAPLSGQRALTRVVPRHRPALLGRLRRRGRPHGARLAGGTAPHRSGDDDVARGDRARRARLRPSWASVRPRRARTADALAPGRTRATREFLVSGQGCGTGGNCDVALASML